MNMNHKRTLLLLIPFLLIFLSACQPKKSPCTNENGASRYFTELPVESLSQATSDPFAARQQVEIGGKLIDVDRVVEGPICNDTWNGTVYVTCNVQVYAWVDQPTFFKTCNLQVEPGTVVYVAYHNNSAYYNGCSCHTGETSEP
jgi:hypothetical protein